MAAYGVPDFHHNPHGASFDVQFGGNLLHKLGGDRGQFNKGGTFTKSGAAVTANIALVFNNDGTADVQSGTLKLSGGGTSSVVPLLPGLFSCSRKKSRILCYSHSLKMSS